MYVLHASNPDHALQAGVKGILDVGIATPSRNGPVLRFPTPVTTVWHSPHQRVSFNAIRDSNPFFMIAESMWMLNGRNDVATMAYYAKQMATYTDDETTLNGAYGYRWRSHFGYDQLEEVIKQLQANQASRRCVISMWDGSREFYASTDSWSVKKESDLLNQTSKDLPCNLQVIVDATLEKLDITVTNRSNDMIWGAYGANAVHFAFLQEYLADRIGIPVGTYYQMSNNMHMYTEFDVTKRFVENVSSRYIAKNDALQDPQMYTQNKVTSVPLNAHTTGFDGELTDFVNRMTTMEEREGYFNAFLEEVASPMMIAYNLHKNGETKQAHEVLSLAERERQATPAVDWLSAGTMWLERRIKSV